MSGSPAGLDLALDFFRRGDLAGARAEGEAALAREPDNATFLHFLGVVRCRNGELREGADYLRQAIALEPSDIACRMTLAKALIDLGELEEAGVVCSAEAPEGAAGRELRRLRGYIQQALGRFAEAVRSYEAVVQDNPRDWESWNNLGNARGAAGDLDGAAEALGRAAELRPDLPAIHFNLGLSLGQAGRLDDALRAFSEAVRLAPDNSPALLEIGRLLQRLGRHTQAVAPLTRAVQLDPRNPYGQLELGRVAANLRRFEEAERAYHAALALRPNLAATYLELGILLEVGNRLAELSELLRRAQAEGVSAHELAYLHALSLQRGGRLEEALSLARQAPATVHTAKKEQLIGTLADRLGDSSAAFAAFEQMNRAVAEDNPNARAGAQSYRSRISTMTASLTEQWYRSWHAAAHAPAREAPVFLVGFPRSGTTLLDTILMGHPDIHVLEEEPLLPRVGDALGDFEGLPHLAAEEIDRLRGIYFDGLDKLVPPPCDKSIVDKLPLNITGAALIHRLFPDARIVFAQRHPCDVVLSCFMQNFEINDAMANFLDLNDAARLYDLVLTLWERSREILPLRVHTVRYEALVENPEAEVRPLLEFINVPWDDKVLQHQRTAAERGTIITPSYAQVAQPIYDRARGRWERYREHLAPVLPILEPWAERLGYGSVLRETA